MDCVVTTSSNGGKETVAVARHLAQELGLPLVTRGKSSLAKLREKFGVSQLLVCCRSGPVLYTPTGRFFFHPNMAKLRVEGLKKGERDYLVEAMDLKPGMEVLDCTLGFGADAIVCSYVVSKAGRVVALEVSPLIAALTAHGLQNYRDENQDLIEAMRRITVIKADYNEYLLQLPARSFDIVYFDPMFREPVQESVGLASLRILADHRAVPRTAIDQARRVARRRVIIKERRNSGELERLGFDLQLGSKAGRVVYGVMIVGEDGH